ncbi:hypothetical protein LBMAG57_17810 [Verrucomicrobiota bacterium]|jgi:hypothetical protein|nr:hypothetical protein LBMAG57_17810 [Verrucomicrobiota bacterium]
MRRDEARTAQIIKSLPDGVALTPEQKKKINPPHSPAPIPALKVSGAAGGRRISEHTSHTEK